MDNLNIRMWREWVSMLPDNAPEKVLIEIVIEKKEDDNAYGQTEKSFDNELNEFIYPH